MDTVGSYDPILVGLSIVIAIGASYTALDMAERVSDAKGPARHQHQPAGRLGDRGGHADHPAPRPPGHGPGG